MTRYLHKLPVQDNGEISDETRYHTEQIQEILIHYLQDNDLPISAVEITAREEKIGVENVTTVQMTVTLSEMALYQINNARARRLQ